MTAEETCEQMAMRAATLATRQIIAQSKNPRTVLGQYKPGTVAFHAAWAAVNAYNEMMEPHQRARQAGTVCGLCGRRPGGPAPTA